ncbi:MAG: hypothetical protein K9N34_03430 [Candidatus Marinimicrobia bacterium]|nr:hypothetical protein [Candidatus Neomarinimicrobiota bacterium]MCF7839597.1 hypothetical protein [Candidatus Neomarinimicrobiota bacterium]
MKKYSWFFILSLVWISMMPGATVRVNLINGTTGVIPQVEVVDLVVPMLNMQSIGSVKPENGTAVFANVDMNQYPALLAQATYEGVTYTETIRENTLPGADPGTFAADLQVFEVATQPDDSLFMEIPFFVITAFGDSLYIQKEYRYVNNSMPPRTFLAPDGLIKFYLPRAGQGSADISVTTGSTPVRAIPNISGETAVLTSALKPGETKVDIIYRVPFTNERAAVRETFFNDVEHFHLYARPSGLSISSRSLRNEGVNEEENVGVYAAMDMKAGETMTIQVSGSSMSNMQPVLRPRLSSTHTVVLVVLSILLLAIGLSYTLTHEPVTDTDESSQITALQRTRTELLHQLAAMTDGEATHEKQKLQKRLRKIYQRLQEHDAL